MKKQLLNILSILSCLLGYAQQETMYSQYMFNNMLVNPGSTGAKDFTEVIAIYRNQWSNIDGAPVSALVCADGLVKNKKLGLGIFIQNEKIGANTRNDVYANVAYHLKLSEKLKLSFGLKPGISQLSSQLNSLTVWDSGDEVFTSNHRSITTNIGCGVFLYSSKVFAGISLPSSVYFQNNTFKTARHYYLQGGYNYAITEKVLLKPSLLIKYLPSAPVQADINMSVVLNQQLYLGISYRTKEMIVFMAQFQAGKNIKIGYAYDYWTAKNIINAGATHELMLSYSFIKNKSTIIDPRYF